MRNKNKGFGLAKFYASLTRGLLLTPFAFAMPASAIHMAIGTDAGVMQQPTSHYYHAKYGASLEISTKQEGLAARLSYFSRPAFRAAGYQDQDSGEFFLLGSKLTKATGHGLYAYFGFGRIYGYTKAIGDTKVEENSTSTRSYLLRGATATAEYAVDFSALRVALAHQTFCGVVDQSQFMAFVGWPYNLFHVTFAYRW